jgi:UDP-glucose 4-epimerase
LFPYITHVAKGYRDYLRVFGNNYKTPDGTGVRDYIHVVDLAIGHLKALEAELDNGVHVYNLGTGIGYSVLDAIQTFERVNGAKITYRFVDRRPGDVAVCYSNPNKAKETLNWEAKRNLEQMCYDSWKFENRQELVRNR